MPLNCEVAKAVVLIVVAVFAEYNLISKSVPGVKVRLVLIGRLLQLFDDIQSYDADWDKGYINEEDYYYNVLRPLVKKAK